MADTQPSSPSRPSCRSLEGRVSFSTIADGSRLDQISGVHAADLAVSDSIAMRNWHFEKSQIVFSRFDPHFDRPPEVLVFHWPLSQLAIAVRCYRRRGIGSSGCQQVACTAICFCMLLHTAVAIDPSLSIELKMWRETDTKRFWPNVRGSTDAHAKERRYLMNHIASSCRLGS